MPPGKGVVEGNEIPYKPEALAQKKKNFEKRDTDDPGFAECYLPGVPRATYMSTIWRAVTFRGFSSDSHTTLSVPAPG